MKTKKASRSAKKPTPVKRVTASASSKRKATAPKKSKSAAKSSPAAPRAKAAAVSDKYRQSGAPWWKAFL